MNEKQKLTSWHEAYREVAECLYRFQQENPSDDEKTVSAKLFDLFNETAFSAKNRWFVKGIERWKNHTLDPIQLFASFSHSTSSYVSRYENLKIVLEIFKSDKEIVESEDFFIGCPTVMMSRPVTPRDPFFQNEIWTMFTSIMNDRLPGLKEEVFFQYQKWYGIDIVSLTIFFFWIDSEKFVPLDSSTRSFLVGLGIWDQTPYGFQEYVAFCLSIPSDEIIRDIVKIGYQVSQGSDTDIIYRGETQVFLGIADDELQKSSLPFRIIAIEPTQEGGYCKLLKKKVYQFYYNYEFVENSEIIHYNDTESTRNLFKQDVLNVQISAIVGKNGSGKSTISELLFLAINTVSKRYENLKDDLDEEEVFVNVYFSTENLYKLVINGNSVKLFRYKELKGEGIRVFERDDRDVFSSFNFSSFFYSVGINYSIYGLNQKVIGDWIFKLFHKNDGYQVPVVLNPYRENGIIDPNSEEALAKSRLLSHILDLNKFELKEGEEDIELEYDEVKNAIGLHPEDFLPVELVEGKRPIYLDIKFDRKKYNKLLNNYEGYRFEYHFEDEGKARGPIFPFEDIRDSIWECLGNPDRAAKNYVEELEKYLVYKIFSIAETHPDRYAKFINVNKIQKIIEFREAVYLFILELLNDSSHITFKFWQAINFLIHGHINVSEGGVQTKVINQAVKIDNSRRLAFKMKFGKEQEIESKSDCIHLVPPSLFDVDILFEDEDSFKELSSGEKQSIFAINTVAYHLYNLDSIDPGSGLITYPYVNIILDEVELYFHPDMQRTFVYNLLKFLNGLSLDKIRNINIQFITHSPFILSDIPSSNILRLNEGEPEDQDKGTFAANIYDLLKDEFFLGNGVIGEFAKDKINGILGQSVVSEKDIEVLELIGDPLLKRIALEKAYAKIKDTSVLSKQIEKLQKQLNSIENEGD